MERYFFFSFAFIVGGWEKKDNHESSDGHEDGLSYFL